MAVTRILADYRITISALVALLLCWSLIVLLHWKVGSDNAFFAPANSILAGLSATFIVTIIYDRVMRGGGREEWLKIVSDAVEKVLARRENLRTQGINAIHSKFNSDHFEFFASRAKTIYILQTYDPQTTNIRAAILNGLNCGAEVKIALIKPTSPFVDARFPELAHTTRETYVGQIEENIRRFKDWASKQNGRGTLEIRQYDGTPGICLYATNEVALIGNFLRGVDAVGTPYFEMDSTADLYKKIYLDHFNQVWRDATPVRPN